MVNSELLLEVPSLCKIQRFITRGFFQVCTDSRHYQKDEIFLALNGPNFQGVQFLESVLEKNCSLVIYQDYKLHQTLIDKLLEKYPKASFLEATETVLFLQQLASLHAQKWSQANRSRKIVGISGSNGKTTTKEMLFHLLNSVLPGKVICTEKNYNNHIGVPKTLLRINENLQFAIVELGSNHPGEMQVLCDIMKPQWGIVTNIGQTHLEFFHSEEKVFLEESLLYEEIRKNTQGLGICVSNGDDQFLKNLNPSAGLILTYEGKKRENNKCWMNFSSQKVEINYGEKTFTLENPLLTGKHNFRNMAVAFTLAINLLPSWENVLVKAAQNFVPLENRSSWIEREGKQYFLDAYNANPSSMKESLSGFYSKLKDEGKNLKKLYFILGQMNELGPYSKQYHREVAQYLKLLGGENVAFVGEMANAYKEGFEGEAIICHNVEELKKSHWDEIQKKYDFIFIKGSRSVKLESLLGFVEH